MAHSIDFTPTNETAIAYSYIRFSSAEQRKGDSLRRQLAKTEAWCERNGFRLDTTLSLRDLGVSAFRGKHRDDKFALGSFLKLVERGRIPKGSFLIIENLDRLSREDERKALRLWMDILDAGINIVQLTPETVYRHEKSDMVDIMRAIIDLSRGHNESVMKSDRIGQTWAEKKKRARERGETLTGELPGWVEMRGGKRCLKPGAKATIKRIFQLSVHGYGEVRITRLLTDDKVMCFGDCGHWTRTYVRRLLRDRRLLGEHQPRIKATGEADGEVIRAYYPAVLSEAEFYAAQRGRVNRTPARGDLTPVELSAVESLHLAGELPCVIARKLGVNRFKVYRALIKLGVREKPPEEKHQGVYLFGGLCYRNGCRYMLHTWSRLDPQHKVLTLKDSGQPTFPYFVFERALLHELKEISPREVLDGANGHDTVVAMEGEYGAIDSEIQQINADMEESGFSPALGKRIRKLEERLAEVARQLRTAQEKAANPLSATWGEAKTLLAALEAAPDPEDARIRLRAALRRIIESIQLIVVHRGIFRVGGVQIWFAGGERQRSYLIVHKRAFGSDSARIPAETWCDSLATAADPADLDLRRPEDARDLETFLADVKLETLFKMLKPLPNV